MQSQHCERNHICSYRKSGQWGNFIRFTNCHLLRGIPIVAMALEIKKQIIQNLSVERFPKNLAIIQNIESIKFDLGQDLQEKIEDQRVQKNVQKIFSYQKSTIFYSL